MKTWVIGLLKKLLQLLGEEALPAPAVVDATTDPAWERVNVLVDWAEGAVAPGTSGEIKRRMVLGKLALAFDRPTRELAWLLEEAIRQRK